MATGRAVQVQTTVVRAVDAARKAGRMRPEHEPYAALARKIAKAVDNKDVSIADLTRLSTQLTALLSRLPLGEETRDDRPAAATGGAGPNGSHPARLAAVVGTGASVGDTALPR